MTASVAPIGDPDVGLPDVGLAELPPISMSPISASIKKAQVRAALFGKVEPVRVGRFVLLEQLGAGGMGEIYAAYDEHLDRRVALKLCHHDSALSYQVLLLREAKVLAQVSHPNVVQVYEAGLHEGRVFVAMELVHGQTLTRWLNTADALPRRQRQREVLRRFIAAGRGLEASHVAGVAHRDFKPDNVLVGDDGRVRVVDFGLARVLADDLTEPAPPPDEVAAVVVPDDEVATVRDSEIADHATREISVELREVGDSDLPTASGAASRVMSSLREITPATRLTRTGVMMGTLPFTAPEQRKGVAADHRSDQFSFCVALYHALYGEFPPVGAPPQRLPTAIVTKVRGLEHGVGVGQRLRKALHRGLSVDADERFDSMGDLLSMLEPGVRPRSVGIAGAVLLFILGVVALLWAPSQEDPCASAGDGFAAVWSTEHWLAMRDAFARSDLPYADHVRRKVTQQLDDYDTRWRKESVAACRATHVDHVQSAEMLDRRTACLARDRGQFSLLVTELRNGGRDTLSRAVEAFELLPDPSGCSEVETLTLGPAAPPPAISAGVGAVRRQLDEAATLERVARFDESLALAQQARTIADQLPYPPVRAEALVQVARALDGRKTAAARREAEQLYFEALDIAEPARMDALSVEIWDRLVRLAVQHDSEAAPARARWRRYGAAVRRGGGTDVDQRELHYLLAEIEYRDDHFDAAEVQARKALDALAEADDSPIERGRYYDSRAKALERLNRFDEAFSLREKSLKLAADALGPSHPEVLRIQANYGQALQRRGQLTRARNAFEAALASMPVGYRETSQDAARLHLALSALSNLEGKLDEAAVEAHRGLQITKSSGAPDYRLAEAHSAVGNVELQRERYDVALEQYTQARRLVERRPDNDYQIGLAEGSLAEALAGLSRFDEAMPHVRAAVQVFARGSARGALQGWIGMLRGEVLVEQHQLRDAVPVLEQALQLLEHEADGGNEGRARWALARALNGLGDDPARVRRLAERAHELLTSQGADAHRRDAVAAFLKRLE